MKNTITKRLISAILATACIVTTTIHASAAVSDVKPGNWAYDAVQYNVNNKLIAVDTNKYQANAPAPRQDVAYALYKLVNGKDVEPSQSVTSTVAKDMQNSTNAYKYSVGWCMDKGIIAGTGGGNFAPNAIVTREQMATLLYRTAKYQGLDVDNYSPFVLFMYDDGLSSSDWALDAMAWCVSNGLMNGTGNNKLSPKTTLTYAQLAQFVLNFSKFVGENGGSTPTVTPQPTVTPEVPVETPVVTPSVNGPSYYNLTPMTVSGNNDCNWIIQNNYLYECKEYNDGLKITKVLVDLAGPWDNVTDLSKTDWLPAGGYMKNGHKYNDYGICIDNVDGIPSQEEKIAFIMINQHRINNGLPMIEWDQSAQAIAEMRAIEAYDTYVTNKIGAHCRPDGSYMTNSMNTIVKQFSSLGILSQKTGNGWIDECSGMHYTALSEVYGWIKSPGHNAALLSTNTNYAGIAVANDVWSFNGLQMH